MAIKKKNGENQDNEAPHKQYVPPPSEDDTPPCGITEEDIKDYAKNMHLAQYLIDANSKTPVVIAEEVKKIIVERMEQAYFNMTGMTVEAAKLAFP